jgi:hypothetical protein
MTRHADVRVVAARAAKLFCVTVAILGVAFAVPLSAAAATTSITEPTGNPYHVALDANGQPITFTVVARGFPQFTNVFVEQCDPLPPSTPNWSPASDCDIETSGAAANADKAGVVRFDASDPSLAFHPFVGAGPSTLFNCLTAHGKPIKNDVPSYHSCQIRVASNPSHATNDQVFLPIVLGPGTPESDSAHPSKSSRSSTTAILLGIAGVVVVGGVVTALVLRRRHPSGSRPSSASRERALRRR